MTRKETKMWLDSLKKDIGQPQYQALWHYAEAIDMATKALTDMPIGRWMFEPKDAIELMFTKPKCSECGFESADSGNFCSNCGARMFKSGGC